jgi:phosphoglycerate dehydrogenase-like enzyme
MMPEFKEDVSMKLVFLNKLNRLWAKNIEKLRAEFPHVDFVTEQSRIDLEMAGSEALVGGEMTVEQLQRAEKVKIIFVPYAGIDALPLDYIKARRVRISNVHGNARFVAERCIAMALAFYGKIIDYHNDLKNSQWHGYWAKATVDDTWRTVQGRACAVIGTGEIGRYLAKYLKVFDCTVIGFKKSPPSQKPEPFDEVTLDLEEALAKSELVFITLPLTRETRGMFSAEILAKMRDKFLVNVGRGDIVDEEGLYRALKEGILKGAGIDVWYAYPKRGETTAKPSRFPIQALPNVILSPHLAGFTPEAAALNIAQTIENIRSYLGTGKAVYEVDPELMY